MTIAWPATTFSPLINGQSRQYALAIRKNRFGGGYQQRVNQNLNQLDGQFSFTVFTNELTTGQRFTDLEALLRQSKGTEPYTIRFAGETVDRNVVINAWKVQSESPAVQMVTIEAELFNDPSAGSTTPTTPTTSASYRAPFTNASISGGFLTVNHNLGQQFVLVSLVDDQNRQILTMDAVTCTSTTVCTIDMGSFGTISGTWRVVVISG